jgi:hypothetical protein
MPGNVCGFITSRESARTKNKGPLMVPSVHTKVPFTSSVPWPLTVLWGINSLSAPLMVKLVSDWLRAKLTVAPSTTVLVGLKVPPRMTAVGLGAWTVW